MTTWKKKNKKNTNSNKDRVRTIRWLPPIKKAPPKEHDTIEMPVPELLIASPADGAIVPLDFSIRVIGSGLDAPWVSRVALIIDQLWLPPGDRLCGVSRLVLLDPGERDAVLMLEEGRHLICAQAIDIEGRTLDLFDAIEIEAQTSEGSSFRSPHERVR
jgi:hypothetical protein